MLSDLHPGRWMRGWGGNIVTLVILLVAHAAHSQLSQIPIPWLIGETKPSVLPVLAWRNASEPDSVSLGTCVLVGKEPRILALTCEHVLAVKDTAGRTVRYAEKIAVSANRVDGTATLLQAVLLYADARRDFALLALSPDTLGSSLHLKYIQPSRWQQKNALQEGETIIYIGYPMGIGMGRSNYPLSRTGIVSQVTPEGPFFLVDGFVQHGHSGSPVFVLREVGRRIPPRWDTYLVGIAAAFPKEYSNVLQEVRLERAEGRKVLVNPGFTVVTSMDEVISVLERRFGVIK